MSSWNKISLCQFQQIQIINARKGVSDIDKVLFSVCALFGLTEHELNNAGVKRANKLINQVTKIFNEQPVVKAVKKIGKYFFNYNPSDLTLGQYITLARYISEDAILNAHKILATISYEYEQKYTTEGQMERQEYFLTRAVTETLGAIKLFNERYGSFNKEYSSLFGVGTENAGEIESDPFHKRYGWIFSATLIADHNRITLDDAYGLPIRQAFNDLAYLKAKAIFDEKQTKKHG